MTLADEVVSSFDGAASPRLAELMTGLVRHLHAFVAEVGLTEQEWTTAIDFLTRTGQKCDEKRQEFILLSDVLGASMAVINANHPTNGAATESTVLGPFFVPDAPEFGPDADISAGAPGTPCHVRGTVRTPTGAPIPNADIDVWQSDETGHYDVQYADLDHPRARARLHTDAAGRFSFHTIHPEAYPIPTDGPVGELLNAASRSPMRPAHIHFKITAPGYHPLTTHLFAAGDPHLSSDAVFGVKPSLIVNFSSHQATYDFTLAELPPTP
jgi:hydroxyquinol 1,2-dioxygenase